MSKQSRLIQKSFLIGGSLVLVVAVSVGLGVFNENTSQETFSESISSGLGAIPAPEFNGELERKVSADARPQVLAYDSKLGVLPVSSSKVIKVCCQIRCRGR